MMSCFLAKTIPKWVAASLITVQITSEAWPATQLEIVASCESCHGVKGNSQVASTPRLNGQQINYLSSRLKRFSEAARENPHAKIGMFKLPAVIRDADRRSVAGYFAGQAPTYPKPGASAAEGKRIYETGMRAENVIACNQCHGAQGEGHDLSPRLAGQHAQYLKDQLRLFHLKFREHVLMYPNTKTMSENTIDALVSYLAND